MNYLIFPRARVVEIRDGYIGRRFLKDFIVGVILYGSAVWTLPNSGIYAKQYYDDLEYDRVDIRLVEPSGRVERSQELPHKMTFHLLSEKTNVHVRLKRAPKINIPTYVSSGGKIQQTYIADYQTSGVYVNVQMGNVMMVTDRGGYYDLNGRVNINNSNNFNMQPVGSGKHRLSSSVVINYGPDEIQTSQKGHVSLSTMKTVMNRRRRRYKRASKSYAVELLAVTDYTIKQRFLSRNGGSEDLANSEIKTYYAFLIMGMSERYATITNYYPDVDFSIKGAGIVISNSADDAEYHQRSNKNGILQYITALSEFTEWVYENSKNGELPTHDHAMWFTDDSLAVGKSTDVIGVAWVGTMCTKNSTSIVEEYFTGRTDQIAAHELGHSLNAVHDGDVRGCSNDDSYVMAASSYFPDDKKKSNPWIFSECSALYISYYAPEFKCLSSLSATSSLSTSVLPGQYLDADEQCRIFYGNTKSYFCRNEQLEGFGFDLMCQRMYCYDPSSSSCQTVIAKDFTSCGSEMWCFQGACVTSASAPVTLANCPQGDNKAMGCYSSACGLYDARKLVDCCQSCVGYVPVVQTKNNDKAKRGGGAVGAGAIQGPGIENENGNTICETWDLTCIYCKSNQKYMETQQCVKYRSI